MSNDATKGVYPLSGLQGEAIPHDVGDPQGVIIIAVTSGASSAQDKAIPADYEIMTLFSTVDALIGFDPAGAITTAQDTHKEDHIVLPAKTPTTIRNRWTKLRTYGLGAGNGLLYIQKWRRWQATDTQTGIQRTM